jgi:hypothetical protein
MDKISFNNLSVPMPNNVDGINAALNSFHFINLIIKMNEEKSFTFPEKVSISYENEYYKKGTVKYELLFSNNDVSIALSNLYIFMMGNCFQQASNALEIKYGKIKREKIQMII